MTLNYFSDENQNEIYNKIQMNSTNSIFNKNISYTITDDNNPIEEYFNQMYDNYDDDDYNNNINNNDDDNDDDVDDDEDDDNSLIEDFDQENTNNNFYTSEKNYHNTTTTTTTTSTALNFNQRIKILTEKDCLNQEDIDKNMFKQRVKYLNDTFECFKLKHAFTEQIPDKTNNLLISKKFKTSKALQRKLMAYSQLLQTIYKQINNDADSNDDMKFFYILEEYKRKIIRCLRSLVERVCVDTVIPDSNHNNINSNNNNNNNNNNSKGNNNLNQISSNPTARLWTEIRARGCQFLGPTMQDDVLLLISHFLSKTPRISRKGLVTYVVGWLKVIYDKASRTSVGHVIQLLYRAGCFKVEKRPNESSGMELKREYLNYEQLRKQHDTQIISIAIEAGIHLSPEQWSQKLYGDSNHKSKMQSIIDKLHSQQTLKKIIEDFFKKLEKLPSNFEELTSIYKNIKNYFMLFANMDENIYGNLNSKVLSSETNSIIDTNSDNDSNSVHSQQNQFNCLNWEYIYEAMHNCINILEASFKFNTLFGSSITNNSNTNNNLQLTQNTNQKYKLQQNFQLQSNELQSRSLMSPSFGSLKQSSRNNNLMCDINNKQLLLNNLKNNNQQQFKSQHHQQMKFLSPTGVLHETKQKTLGPQNTNPFAQSIDNNLFMFNQNTNQNFNQKNNNYSQLTYGLMNNNNNNNNNNYFQSPTRNDYLSFNQNSNENFNNRLNSMPTSNIQSQQNSGYSLFNFNK